MDQNSPVTRVERTLWTVWCYITEAVNRFFRPQPADAVSSNPNPPCESGAEGEPPDSDLKQDNAINSSEGGKISEEQPHASASFLSPPSSTVAWVVCTDDLKSDEEDATQLRIGNESKESEDGGSMRGEDFDQTVNDLAKLLDSEDATVDKVEQEQKENKTFHTCEQSGAPKNDEKSADAESESLTDETVSKRLEESDEEACADEESKTQDDHQNIDEAMAEIQVTEDEVVEDLQDEEKLCTITYEEDNKPEEGVDTDDVAPTLKMKDENICEGALQVSSATENTPEERREEAENQLSVCEVLSENELIVAEEEIGGEDDEIVAVAATEEEDISEAAQKQAEDEDPETEHNNRTIRDSQQEEKVLTQFVTSSVQKTQQDIAEFTSEEEDVVVTSKQTTDTDVIIAETNINKSFLDKNQVGMERPFREVDNKESCVEIVCTSVTVKPETEQEISREFKNIPQRITEGQAIVLHELNSEASEETQEGVPEHNNELEFDENKTQSFLEGGNCGEIHITPLPEEVEEEEQESLKSSGTGADYLLEREILEETHDSTDRSNNKFELAVEELTENQHLAQDTEKPQTGKGNLESEFLFEEEQVEFLDSSMKTEFEALDKKLETCVETDKTTEELQDEVKTPEFGISGESVSAKEAAGDGGEREGGIAADKGVEFTEEISNFLVVEVEKITETSFCLESEQSKHSHQKSDGTSTLPEEMVDLEVLQQTEIKLSDDSVVEILHVESDTREKDSTDEEEEDNKMQDINDITPLQLAETTDELVKTKQDKENTLITESELFLHPERQEMINQSLLEANPMQEKNTITNIIAAAESKTVEAKDLLEMSAEETKQEERYTEETSSSITAHQDAIDEEILDLWIETAMSKDTDNVEEDQFEIQKVTTEHQLKEKSVEISSESEKELLMEPHLVEPTSVSDTEMSSSIQEPGFLDQTQQLKPTETLKDIHDMLATTSQSAEFSEFSALDSESQAVLMEETAEKVESFLREEEPGRVTESCSDSGVSSSEEKHLNGESERSQEEPDDIPPETEAEVKTETTALVDTEEAEVMAMTDINVHFQAETRVEDEPVKDIVLEEGIILTEPPSGGEHWIESEKNQILLDHRCSEDITELLPGPSGADVAEEETTMFEDQDEVDALLLDSTIQRSRISVKNPRVRPPTDPRSLIHMPSADPTPPLHVPVKVPPGVPLGGLGMGIKLPGFGAGFPVLKKTQRSKGGENNQDTQSQEPEKKSGEKSEGAKQDEAQHKPKWMPPGHAGFGNPLMSELKTKLKKTTKE
ncbi:titin homolog [Kryptolebias marmoratus]|uniref:titin homolog n=1 Tax=Kryptolebias marmoratus TaxID=37003 RepID=UPI000D52FE9C|nr:titin homolog [Kryptolebias marmoratus]